MDDKNKVPNDRFYFRSYSDIAIHEEMISDRVRTSTYKLAILKNYDSIKGKIVLDIGAGTGILSMFCIQAGARKVYAIEASDMAEQAELVFKQNEVSDIVTVIKSKVEDIELPETVDVIVSEWMGYFLFYETMLPSVLYARDKWLKKGGLLLPGSASLHMAPVTDPDVLERVSFWDDVADMYGVNMSCLKPYASRCIASHITVQDVEPQNIMAHATVVCTFDLHTVSTSQLEDIKGEFCFDCFGDVEVHGFATWFEVSFNHDIILSTSPYKAPSHWQQCVLYINEPLSVRQGTLIKGSIQLNPSKLYHRFLDITLQYTVDGKNFSQKYIMDDFIS